MLDYVFVQGKELFVNDVNQEWGGGTFPNSTKKISTWVQCDTSLVLDLSANLAVNWHYTGSMLEYFLCHSGFVTKFPLWKFFSHATLVAKHRTLILTNDVQS